MKKLLLLSLVLAPLAVGAWLWLGKSNQLPSRLEFQAVQLEFGTITETVSATGVLQPVDLVIVGTGLQGQVVEVCADYNQQVREGDILARLDDRLAKQDVRQAEVGIELAKSALLQARAQLQAARKALERQKQMPASIGRQTDLEASEAQVAAADAGVAMALAQLAKAEEARDRANLALSLTVIRVPKVERSSPGSAKAKVEFVHTPSPSPSEPNSLLLEPGQFAVEQTSHQTATKQVVSYRVLERKVELNQQVGPPVAAKLFTLSGDLSQMRVSAQVAEGDISKIAPGQHVSFTVSTYTEEDLHFAGKVTEVRLLPSTISGAIYYEAIIEVANERDPHTKEWRLRPGMTASLDIIRRKKEGIWKLPSSALSFVLPAALVTPDAQAKLERSKPLLDSGNWRVIWVAKDKQQAWPVLVRVLTGAKGEAELHDGQFHTVYEFDAEYAPKVHSQVPSSYPHAITSLAGPTKKGLFSAPPLRF